MQQSRNDLPSQLKYAGPYLGLALVIVIFSLLTWWKGTLDDFLSVSNFKLILTHATIIGAAGLGMTIIMIMGGIDLSVGYVISLVTVVMMLAFQLVYPQQGTGLAGMVALLCGLFTGAFVGLCNGLIITRLKVVPFVATLAMLGIARGVGIYLTDGGRLSFPPGSEAPLWMRALGTIDPARIDPDWAWMRFSPSVWSVYLLAVVVALALRYTVLG